MLTAAVGCGSSTPHLTHLEQKTVRNMLISRVLRTHRHTNTRIKTWLGWLLIKPIIAALIQLIWIIPWALKDGCNIYGLYKHLCILVTSSVRLQQSQSIAPWFGDRPSIWRDRDMDYDAEHIFFWTFSMDVEQTSNRATFRAYMWYSKHSFHWRIPFKRYNPGKHPY